jgi:putative lipoic acid-binding regulatory protein
VDYDRLKSLLESQEKFPYDFILKFIGVNSPAFLDGVRNLGAMYPQLRKVGERKSAKGSNLALTFMFRARNADEIITLLKSVSTIPDVKVVL